MSMPTLANVASPQDVELQNALSMLLAGNFTPSFDASQPATPWKEPGAVPTIQQAVNPALLALQPQLAGLNANVEDQGGGHPSSAVTDAYNALLAYLEETSPNDVVKPTGPGIVTSGGGATGGGTTYIDPATGQTKVAF
jgi:hypothetical protein